jgi:hypothetical protein
MAHFDVAVYYSSLPKIADRTRKMQVLEAFAQGAKATGANTIIVEDSRLVNARLAVILGWVGTKIKGTHIMLRKGLIEHQAQTGNFIMPIDSSCFKFADPDSYFLRYSLDGVFYNTNNYANTNSTDTQWKLITQNFPELTLQPWRTGGGHILLCLQRDGGWSMKGTDLNVWASDTIRQLKTLTTRPIRIRPHPRARNNVHALSRLPGVTISDPGVSLQQDLHGAWASVFYNSSSSVASILAGVPVFATDPDCVAWSVANHQLQHINDPKMPEREQWLYDLAACHWSDQQSMQGHIYQRFRQFL